VILVGGYKPIAVPYSMLNLPASVIGGIVVVVQSMMNVLMSPSVVIPVVGGK